MLAFDGGTEMILLAVSIFATVRTVENDIHETQPDEVSGYN